VYDSVLSASVDRAHAWRCIHRSNKRSSSVKPGVGQNVAQ
jgi:hypothetical protein